MGSFRNIHVCLIVLVSSVAACAGSDDMSEGLPDDESAIADTHSAATRGADWRARWYRYRRPVGSSTGGTTGAGGSSGSAGSVGSAGSGGNLAGAGCEICTKAQACCEAVSGGYCPHSAAVCSSYTDDIGRQAYINSCKTLLTTTSMAWSGNPPSACL
jgi:hypothetical protein